MVLKFPKYAVVASFGGLSSGDIVGGILLRFLFVGRGEHIKVNNIISVLCTSVLLVTLSIISVKY